jgi:replication factor C small subunit
MAELNEDLKNMLWEEKYRPQTVDDCILPKKTKAYFIKQRDTGSVNNMLLAGSHGVGKCLGYHTKIDIIVSEELFEKIISEGIEYEE